MSTIYKFPSEIKNSYESFNNLINMHQLLGELFLENVDIDFAKTSYLEANLSALMGAIFDSTDVFVNINFCNLIHIKFIHRKWI